MAAAEGRARRPGPVYTGCGRGRGPDLCSALLILLRAGTGAGH